MGVEVLRHNLYGLLERSHAFIAPAFSQQSHASTISFHCGLRDVLLKYGSGWLRRGFLSRLKHEVHSNALAWPGRSCASQLHTFGKRLVIGFVDNKNKGSPSQARKSIVALIRCDGLRDEYTVAGLKFDQDI